MKTAETSTTSLSVLVPVYNELYLVETSLDRLQILAESALLSRVQVVVVDDGSTDGTSDVLRKYEEARLADPEDQIEWRFVYHEANKGKGGAIQTALAFADAELSVIHDADLEYHPRDLLTMVPIFLEEEADAVFGSRFLASRFRRVLFFRHSLGNRFLTLLCNLVSDLNLTDMETCYKMVRTEELKSIPLRSNDFRMEPELTIKLAKRGARIFEVPISYAGRTYQEGKKITWRDGAKAVLAIFRFGVSDDVYTEDDYGSQILARLSRAPRFTEWMADTLKPHVGQEVLEIGAGIGNLTLHLTPRRIYHTSDINPLYLSGLEKLQQTRPYLDTGFTDVTMSESFPKDRRFDTVICLNVIEHVDDDVAALRNIHEALSDDGRAVVLVPRYPALMGTLDEVLGHHRRYTHASLTKLAEDAGFKLTEMLEFNRAAVPAWWLNGRVLRRRRFSLFQMKALNLTVPLLRHLDRFRFLPSLSLIAILEKADTDEA